jgi:hypothetical protein
MVSDRRSFFAAASLLDSILYALYNTNAFKVKRLRMRASGAAAKLHG